jgi:hypothetical protein
MHKRPSNSSYTISYTLYTGLTELYTTGRGSIPLRATHHLETLSASTGLTIKTQKGTEGNGKIKTKQAIIIDELPYMTNKAGMLIIHTPSLHTPSLLTSFLHTSFLHIPSLHSPVGKDGRLSE